MLFLPIPFTSTCPVLLAGTVLAGVAAKDLLCPQMSYKKSPSKTEPLKASGKRNQGKKSQFKTAGHETALHCTQCSMTPMAWPSTAVHICSGCNFKPTSSRNSGKKKKEEFLWRSQPKKHLSPSPAQDHGMTASICWKLVWKAPDRYGDTLKVSNKTHFLLAYTFIL